MAVKQTPQGREIGLFVEDDQPKVEPKTESLFDEEPKEPKRAGRPKKQ